MNNTTIGPKMTKAQAAEIMATHVLVRSLKLGKPVTLAMCEEEVSEWASGNEPERGALKAEAARMTTPKAVYRLARKYGGDRPPAATTGTAMNNNTTIGPKMQRALSYIIAHPGCSKLAAAREVGPHGSTFYGYKTVNRLIKRGLIRAAYTGSKYELFPASWTS